MDGRGLLATSVTRTPGLPAVVTLTSAGDPGHGASGAVAVTRAARLEAAGADVVANTN